MFAQQQDFCFCEAASAFGPALPLTSEPYAEPEVTRSVPSTLDLVDIGMVSNFGPFGGFDKGCFGKDVDEFGADLDGEDSDEELVVPPRLEPLSDVVALPNAACPSFAKDERPPRLTHLPFAPLASTSITAQVTCPAELANGLENAIRHALGVPAERVHPTEFAPTQQFALTATVRWLYATCKLSFRMYEVDSSEIVVEVLRDEGDAVLFMAAYRAVKQHLAASGVTLR